MISKFKRLVEDPHKKELLAGSFSALLIKMAGLIMGYALVVYLGRNYGAEAVGIYQISVQFAMVLAIVSLLGFDQAIIRFSSELVKKRAFFELKSLMKMFGSIALIFSVLLSIIVYKYSNEIAGLLLKDEGLSLIFKSLAMLLPFLMLNVLFVEFLRGLKKIKASEFLRLFATRFLNFITLVSILWVVEFNHYIPVISFEIASILSFILALYFVYKYMSQEEVLTCQAGCTKSRRFYISTSITMYQSALLMILSNQFLMFILAYYGTPKEVGIYNTAFQVATLGVFVFSSVVAIGAPKYSELYNSNDKCNFQRVVRLSSKVIFWATGSISIITIIFAEWIMSFFGSEFVDGTSILVVLSIGNLINALTGPGGVILDMVGAQKIRRNILILNTSLTVILSFMIVPSFGGLGLAYVILINMILGNFLAVFYIYRKMGVNITYFPLYGSIK